MNGEFLRGLLTALVGAGMMLVMTGCTVDDGEADCACAEGQTAVEGKCYADSDVNKADGEDPTLKNEDAQSFPCQAAAGGSPAKGGDNGDGGGGDDAGDGGGDDSGDGGGDPASGGDNTGDGGGEPASGGDDSGDGGGAPAGGMSMGPDTSGLGQPCGNEDAGFGYCADENATGNDACAGDFKSGLCPGAANIKCCMSHECTLDNGDTGVCLAESTCGQYDGTATAGFCPGNAQVKCCTGLDDDTMMMMSGGGGDDTPAGGADGGDAPPAGGDDG